MNYAYISHSDHLSNQPYNMLSHLSRELGSLLFHLPRVIDSMSITRSSLVIRLAINPIVSVYEILSAIY